MPNRSGRKSVQPKKFAELFGDRCEQVMARLHAITKDVPGPSPEVGEAIRALNILGGGK